MGECSRCEKLEREIAVLQKKLKKYKKRENKHRHLINDLGEAAKENDFLQKALDEYELDKIEKVEKEEEKDYIEFTKPDGTIAKIPKSGKLSYSTCKKIGG